MTFVNIWKKCIGMSGPFTVELNSDYYFFIMKRCQRLPGFPCIQRYGWQQCHFLEDIFDLQQQIDGLHILRQRVMFRLLRSPVRYIKLLANWSKIMKHKETFLFFLVHFLEKLVFPLHPRIHATANTKLPMFFKMIQTS